MAFFLGEKAPAGEFMGSTVVVIFLGLIFRTQSDPERPQGPEADHAAAPSDPGDPERPWGPVADHDVAAGPLAQDK